MEYRHHPVVSQTGPDFAASLAPNGYAWWYLDALSDCGRYGLTVIAMLGCVFSPWYARARRHGLVDPVQHSALNVVLYRGQGRRWAMTERDAAAVTRHSHQLSIGPSRVTWEGDALQIDVDERTSPWPQTLRGQIRVTPSVRHATPYPLDAAARHLWWPIAPLARISVRFEAPALRWHGAAYLDANQGSAPLEDDFDAWNWSRSHGSSRDGLSSSRVLYDTVGAAGHPNRSWSLEFAADGSVHAASQPPIQRMPSTLWGIERHTRCDHGARPRVIETLESAPFYSRSLVETTLEGERVESFHESVSLTRFATSWVRALLPVRLPRVRSRRLL
jgi:carotenoid 1,2-hydratase